MGAYTKELHQRFKDGREAAPLSATAKEVRKNASKRERLYQQKMALDENSRYEPVQPTGKYWPNAERSRGKR